MGWDDWGKQYRSKQQYTGATGPATARAQSLVSQAGGGWGSVPIASKSFGNPQAAAQQALYVASPEYAQLAGQYGQYFVPGASPGSMIDQLNAMLYGFGAGGYGGGGGGGGGGGSGAGAFYWNDLPTLSRRKGEDEAMLAEQFARQQQGYDTTKAGLAQRRQELQAQHTQQTRGLSSDLTARGAYTSEGGRQGFADLAQQLGFGQADVGRQETMARLGFENAYLQNVAAGRDLQRQLENAYTEHYRRKYMLDNPQGNYPPGG